MGLSPSAQPRKPHEKNAELENPQSVDQLKTIPSDPPAG